MTVSTRTGWAATLGLLLAVGCGSDDSEGVSPGGTSDAGADSAADASNDAPVADASIDGPVADASIDGPVADASIDGPVDANPGDSAPSDGPAPESDASVDVWQHVTAAMESAVASGLIEGEFGLLDVYRGSDGVLVYSRAFGTGATRESLIPIASGSKWVTSTVILRRVEAGSLTLEDTTGQWLGWTGPKGNVTLRQLLSFTSGLRDAPLCQIKVNETLEGCAEAVGQLGLQFTPGTTFSYGAGHMTVAGRMAEVATGKSFSQLLDEELVTPLGWDPNTAYYAYPKSQTGEGNPLLAGGLVIRPMDYGAMLAGIQGLGPVPLLSESMFEEQIGDQWAAGTVVDESPNPDPATHYGLGCWRQCPTPDDGAACDAALFAHSVGAFGFVPWIDRQHGYFAVFGAEAPDTQNGAFLVAFDFVYETLRPLVVDALDG